MRRRGGTNGGGTHSSARLSLRAATGRGESILFDIFPSCAYFLNKGFVITFICPTPLHVVAMRQMAAEGQSDKMASDMEVHIKAKVWNRIPPCGKSGTQ